MRARRQFFRYAIVGFATNASIYLLYLSITLMGIGPKLAMTILYVMGVAFSFFFNKNWSFQFAGSNVAAIFRYIAAYAIGYAVNLLALITFVDQVGFAHQLVQGVMIVVVAISLFLAQRYWVFPQSAGSDVV